MYQVIQQGEVIKRYDLFLDAWLFVVLTMVCFTRIIGPEGTWHINPLDVEIN